MRIAFIMPWLLPMPPVRGGAVETLVDSLLRQNETAGEMQITVFTVDDPAARALDAQYAKTAFVPIRVPRAREEAARLLKGAMNKAFHYQMPPAYAYLRAVCRAMRGRKFDAIICENLAAYVPAIRRLNAGDVYLHMHNVVHPDEAVRREQITSGCKKIIAVSDYIRTWTTNNLGARADQCAVLLNCVDVERFRAGRALRKNVREALGISEDQMAFVYTGRLCPEKGALELARAFVDARLPNSRLVFVGSQWFGATGEDEYLRQIRQTLTPVIDRVCFTGYVNHSEMPGYYAAADIAVMPSVWEEPAGLTVLEAQTSGVPVISTQSGGIAQHVCPRGAILLERGDGLEARLTEAMRALAGDAARRAAMGEAARAWSVGRDPARYYREFLRIVRA